jgi:hypothetical protein
VTGITFRAGDFLGKSQQFSAKTPTFASDVGIHMGQ